MSREYDAYCKRDHDFLWLLPIVVIIAPILFYFALVHQEPLWFIGMPILFVLFAVRKTLFPAIGFFLRAEFYWAFNQLFGDSPYVDKGHQNRSSWMLTALGIDIMTVGGGACAYWFDRHWYTNLHWGWWMPIGFAIGAPIGLLLIFIGISIRNWNSAKKRMREMREWNSHHLPLTPNFKTSVMNARSGYSDPFSSPERQVVELTAKIAQLETGCERQILETMASAAREKKDLEDQLAELSNDFLALLVQLEQSVFDARTKGAATQDQLQKRLAALLLEMLPADHLAREYLKTR